MTRTPNDKLKSAIEQAGISHAGLAARVNALVTQRGLDACYTHRSVANWLKGTQPQQQTRLAVAEVLGQRLGRWIPVGELGFAPAGDPEKTGLLFPRGLDKAVATTTEFWSQMHRRSLLTSGLLVAASFVPVCRWLIAPAAEDASHTGGARVGRADIDDLLAAAEDARRADSRFGGGNWRAESIRTCLAERAAPLLHGTYTHEVGQMLFDATAQLSRLAGWTAFDAGQHGLAQRHYVQALLHAQKAGDVALGGYVLACMALQVSLRGYHDTAIDWAQAASGIRAASPRTRSFFSLIEARTHARAGDARSAHAALATAESLLDRAVAGEDPTWIDFHTSARLSADAVEIHRDLGRPADAWRWNRIADAEAGAVSGFARSTGLRGLVLASTFLDPRNPDLEAAAAAAGTATTGLAGVASSRVGDYAADLAHRTTRWSDDPVAAGMLDTLPAPAPLP